MRNFILILILFFISISTAHSQSKIRFGVLAGPALAGNTKQNIHVEPNNPNNALTRTVQTVVTYFGGVVASIPVSKNVIFRPQLEYVLKGWKSHTDFVVDSIQDYDSKVKVHCIDLPLNFVYDAPTQNGRFFIGAGPYLSCALSGNRHDELNGGTTTDIVFNKSDTTGLPANRFDVGINVITAYEFRGGFFLSLNYSYGFINFRTPVNNENPHNKNTVLGLGIGYMFK